jgi:hypothetical protein
MILILLALVENDSHSQAPLALVENDSHSQAPARLPPCCYEIFQYWRRSRSRFLLFLW